MLKRYVEYSYALLLLICFLLMDATAQAKHIVPFHYRDSTQPGFSGVVMWAKNGNVWEREVSGMRDFAKAIPLKEDDIFELASVSKQFTAMIIMMLKEKGMLQYDDRVDQYLSIPYRGITIRHLLTHTSGLPDYQEIMDRYWDKNKVAGNNDILSYLNQYAPPMLFTPGEKYAYSNTGYVLLASIAEKVSGKDFIALCRTWIFHPLNMTDTDIRNAEEKRKMERFAKGHRWVASQKRYLHADSFPASNYTIWLGNRKGPGRISATAADLLKWDQALYTEKLVSKATLAEAFRPMILNNGEESPYGFGWDISTHATLGKIVGHNGDNPGYKTQILRCITQNITIVLLCNNAAENFEERVTMALETAEKNISLPKQ